MAVSNIEKEIKERVRYILATKKKSIASITGNDSERVSFGRHINRDDTSISVLTIYKLLYALHDVDANWLILGEGPMEKTTGHPNIYNHNEVNQSSAGGSINVGTSSVPVPVQMLLEEKDKRIAELEDNNKTLRTVLDSMTAGIRKQ
jgi:hypothetical protein